MITQNIIRLSLLTFSVLLFSLFIYLLNNLPENDFPRMIPLWSSFIAGYFFCLLHFGRKFFKVLAIALPVLILAFIEIPLGLMEFYSKKELIAKINQQPIKPQDQRVINAVYNNLFLRAEYFKDGIRLFQMPSDFRSNYVTTDSLGFRSKEFTQHPDNMYRIIMMGGSAAFGYQAASDTDIVSHQLELLLNARNGDLRRYEVLNLSVPAGNALLDYPIFSTYGLSLNPDMVIFLTGSNDLNGSIENVFRISEMIKQQTSPKLKVNFLEEGVRNLSFLLLRVVYRINLFDYILRRFVGKRYLVWVGEQTDYPDRTQDDYNFFRQNYLKNMTKIYRLAKKANIEVITFQQTHLLVSLLNKKKLTDQEREILAQFKEESLFFLNVVQAVPDIIKQGKEVAGKYGFEYHDLTHLFDDHVGTLLEWRKVSYRADGPMFVSLSHWTAAGNKRVAEAIHEVIKGKVIR